MTDADGSPSSSVHTLETSDIGTLPSTYAAYLRSFNPAEFDATIRALSAYYGPDDPVHVNRVINCRAFSWFAVNTLTGHVRVFSNACRSRWCWHCARARAARIAANVRAWTRTIIRPKLLTLTLKHTTAPLDEQLTALYGFFRKLRYRRKFAALCPGGVWFCQITKSADDEWHPHLHCVLDAEFIPHATIKKLWMDITHGSDIVDIRGMKSPDLAAAYVARYVARPANMADYTTDDQLQIIEAFNHRRLVGTWGTAKAADLTGKPEFNRSDWAYIGSWQQVTVDACSNPLLARAVRAWMDNSPLDPGEIPGLIPSEMEQNPHEIEPDPPPQQLVLFSTERRYSY